MGVYVYLNYFLEFAMLKTNSSKCLLALILIKNLPNMFSLCITSGQLHRAFMMMDENLDAQLLITTR